MELKKTEPPVLKEGLPEAKTTQKLERVKKVQQKSGMKGTLGLMLLVAFVVIAGVTTGYVLATGRSPSVMSSISKSDDGTSATTANTTKVGKLESGVQYDEAEGTLAVDGIEGEGTHHLERTGGDSQNVYLTSSLLNLDDFAGKTVHVWGVTFAGKKAGWLMDVAQVEVK